MLPIFLIPQQEFVRIRQAPLDQLLGLAIIADMCRANALATVKRAGSGHLGSSFSSLDIVTLLYYQHLNVLAEGLQSPEQSP